MIAGLCRVMANARSRDPEESRDPLAGELLDDLFSRMLALQAPVPSKSRPKVVMKSGVRKLLATVDEIKIHYQPRRNQGLLGLFRRSPVPVYDEATADALIERQMIAEHARAVQVAYRSGSPIDPALFVGLLDNIDSQMRPEGFGRTVDVPPEGSAEVSDVTEK